MEATVEEVTMRQSSDEVFGGIIPSKEALHAIHFLETSGWHLIATRSSRESAQQLQTVFVGSDIRTNTCEMLGIRNCSETNFHAVFVSKVQNE